MPTEPPFNKNNSEIQQAKTQLSRRHFIQNSASTILAAGAIGTSGALLSEPVRVEGRLLEPAAGVVKKQKNGVDMATRYECAQVLEQGVFTKKVAFNTTVYPHWIGQSDSFWYTRDIKGGGVRYRLVNAKTGSNRAAFNHPALANALAKASGQEVEPNHLPLADVDIALSPRTVCFAAFGKNWIYDDRKKRCKQIEVPPKVWKVSPDGKKALFVRDYNLWIKDLAGGRERALTSDGEQFYSYAGSPTVYGRQEAPMVDAVWSPDSKRVLTQLIDTRGVGIGMPLVQHVPADGSLRPTILNPERRVAIPGDEQVEAWQPLTIDVESGHMQKADYRPCRVGYPPYAGFFVAGRGWWDVDGRHAYLVYLEREGMEVQLLKWDTQRGELQVLIEETPTTPFTLIPITHIRAPMTPLPESNELIWYSERNGWAHLYLYDLKTGKLKNPITQGDWLVRNVLHYDAERRELFIQTAGRTQGRNPYYCDICRVQIDTGKLTPVLATDHEYVVCDGRSRISYSDVSAKGISPGGRYVVTTRSRVDEVPVSVLLDRDGRELLTLETADVSGLPQNWQWPEPVMMKAADGKSDLYGVVFRPSDFDSTKRYPVLDCTYAYSAPLGAFTNNHTGIWHYLSASAYAELGFIVVMLNSRGNGASGLRNTAFSAHKDTTLPEHNKADCVAGIRQLAERYPYMDLNRVGVAEFGSVPAALTGMLIYPDFYKVGVSINPLADGRLFASMGRGKTDFPQYEQFVANLRGKLLLIHGMLDDVMPVSMNFRLVEALQKANKRFDMLFLPNLGHGFNSYTTQRSWDYVVTHLLGAEPPADFKLTIGLDLLRG